jgi:large repetitive protein
MTTNTAGGGTVDAGHGGGTLAGSAGADTFVFANVDVHATTPPPVTHVTNYHFAEGDTFDFSALTSQFHGLAADDAALVRAVEDASGHFATLQVNTANGTATKQANWVSIAQIDGAHAGDHLNVLVDSNNAVHHVDLLI